MSHIGEAQGPILLRLDTLRMIGYSQSIQESQLIQLTA